VVSVELVLEEAVSEGLAVRLEFNGRSENVGFELVDAVLECGEFE
jgi:hypothetical protein